MKETIELLNKNKKHANVFFTEGNPPFVQIVNGGVLKGASVLEIIQEALALERELREQFFKASIGIPIQAYFENNEKILKMLEENQHFLEEFCQAAEHILLLQRKKK